MFSIMFYTYWGNINVATCFFGIARIYVSIEFYTVLRKIKLATPFARWSELMFPIVFYMYRGSIKVAICFYGIARTDFSIVFYTH